MKFGFFLQICTKNTDAKAYFRQNFGAQRNVNAHTKSTDQQPKIDAICLYHVLF